MTYARAMAEKLTKALLNAFHRAGKDRHAAAFDVAERHVREVIADVRLVIGSDIAEAFERVADIDIETKKRKGK